MGDVGLVGVPAGVGGGSAAAAVVEGGSPEWMIGVAINLVRVAVCVIACGLFSGFAHGACVHTLHAARHTHTHTKNQHTTTKKQVGSICINGGTNLMKLGHNRRAELPEKSRPPISRLRPWQVGVALFTLGNIANFVSFGVLVLFCFFVCILCVCCCV